MNKAFAGNLAATGSGMGHLTLSSTRICSCAFRYSQLADGRLYVECQHDRHVPRLFEAQSDYSLEGRTQNGMRVSASGLHPVPSTGIPGSENVSYRCQRLSAKAALATGPRKTYVFMLSNLTLVRDLNVQWRDMSIKISPVPGYAQAIQRLKAEHNVDITCSASVTTTSSITDRTVMKAINRLCSLLSLARGCMISWIYCEVLSSNEQPLRRFHYDAITKPFSSTRELIASNPPEDMEAFIGQTFEGYLAVDKEFGVFKAIQAFTDAKGQTDFLQMRSLKAVVVMEYLVGRYVRNSGRDYIMSNSGFDTHLDELRTKLGNLLEDVLAPSEDQIEEMLKHVPGLNRYSFSSNLSSLCGSLRLPMNSRDRRRFVSIRNRLVHEADYDPELGTKQDQHAHLLAVVSKTLLGILRFEGYYIDPTRTPGWAGLGNPARVQYQFMQ